MIGSSLKIGITSDSVGRAMNCRGYYISRAAASDRPVARGRGAPARAQDRAGVSQRSTAIASPMPSSISTTPAASAGGRWRSTSRLWPGRHRHRQQADRRRRRLAGDARRPQPLVVRADEVGADLRRRRAGDDLPAALVVLVDDHHAGRVQLHVELDLVRASSAAARPGRRRPARATAAAPCRRRCRAPASNPAARSTAACRRRAPGGSGSARSRCPPGRSRPTRARAAAAGPSPAAAAPGW